MEGARNYVITITAAAIVVGVLTELAGKKDIAGVLVRMIGGLFLAFTVIRPLLTVDVCDIGDYIAAFSGSGAAAVSEGENLSQEAYCSYIISRTEAYILDKAESCGASLTVEVSLSDGEEPVPESVRIQGEVSPYARRCLQEMMEEDLGISKGNQLWIG